MEILVQGKVQCVRSDLQTRDTGVSAGTDTNMKQMNAKVRQKGQYHVSKYQWINYIRL